MIRTCSAWLLALALYALIAHPVHAQDGAASVEVGRVEAGAVALDGRLDEPAWQQAGVIPELTQRNPHPGAPTPYHTRVLLLHDEHTLYIGVRAEDPDLSRLSTHTLVRDGNQSNDDGLTVVLDAVGSRRVAYVFQINAAGAMEDGLISPTPAINSSNGVDYDWDGVWRVVTRRDATGWSAEIAIDTRGLQFDPRRDAWGFNISRYVPRELLTLNWSGLTLDSSVLNLQREGEITGLQGLQQGQGWDFQPYGLWKQTTGLGQTSNAGFDFSYAFTPGVAGAFTYHTDFAEAEADQQQINTTRFPLFFPEKRSFFLQGSNLFSFGYNLNLGTQFLPYYSRTVGLVDGVPVPLEEGAKFLAQSDLGSLALLDTRMGEVTGVAPSADLFVGRGTVNPTRSLELGAIVTSGDPSGAGDNRFVGTDVTWKTAEFAGDKNLNLSAWAGRSSGTLPAGDPKGYGVGIEYPNDLWYLDASIDQYGDALQPALGFLPRPGTRQYFAIEQYGPRPAADSPFNGVAKFFWPVSYSETDGLGPLDGGKQSSEWLFGPALLTYGDDYLELDAYRDTDAPRQAFQPAPDVSIPAGDYAWSHWRIALHSPYQAPLVFSFDYGWGGYYTGTEQHPFVELDWTLPSGALRLSATHEAVFGHLPQGGFVTRLSSLGVTYSFSTDIYLSTLAQYATGIPGVSLNTRLRWIIDGSSNLYLVWNRGLVEEANGLSQPVVTSGSEVILKLQWDLQGLSHITHHVTHTEYTMNRIHIAFSFAMILPLLPMAGATADGTYAEPSAAPALKFAKTPDYGKRLQPLDDSVRTRLLGRWTNPVDHVIIEIASVNLTSGAIRGTEWAQTGPAAGDAHELVGWVSAAPVKEGFDNVLPVVFSTTLYEYGTLPSWAGFFRDGQIVTMHYLIWPNRSYSWDHVSSFQETWTRLP